MLKEVYTLVAIFFESLKDKKVKTESTNIPFSGFSAQVEKLEGVPLTKGGLLKREDDKDVRNSFQ